MSTNQALHERYPDVLSEDPDPALVRVVDGLDTVAASTLTPPYLPRSFDDVLARRTPARPTLHEGLGQFVASLRGLPRVVAIPAVLVLMLVLGGAAYVVIPAVFNVDAGTRSLIASDLGEPLNLSHTADGYTVTVTRGYADANRVIVAYTIRRTDGEPLGQLRPFTATVTTAQGVVLVDHGGGSRDANGGFLDTYDAAPITGNPSDLTLHLTVPSPGSLLETSGTSAPVMSASSPFSFTFTVPFIAGRVANPHEVQTAGGTTVTLERVVVSPTETRAYLSGLGGTGLYADLSVDEWNSAHDSGTGVQNTIWQTPDGLIACDFPQPLMDKHGEWTLTIKAGPATADGRKLTGGPWQFHFVVP